MGVQINGSEGNVIATKGTFSGDVGIGGTLTYEDVTNIDSVGLITARNGIEIGARPGVAASISVDGNMIVSGISTFGGDVQVPDKIIHSGDTNTAIRFPAADTITAETGGSERIRIDSDGKVRFGSGSPTYTFEIQNSGNVEFLLGSTNAGGASILFDGDANGDGGGGDYAQIFHNTSGDMNYRARGGSGASNHIFLTGTAEKLRITSTGQVNIGNTGANWVGPLSIGSGASGAAQVLQIYSNSDTYGAIFFGDATSGAGRYVGDITYNHSSNYMRFVTNGTERVRIDSSGYLIAKGDIRLRRTASDNGALYFGDTNNNYIFGSDADDVITFATAGSEKARIDSSGISGTIKNNYALVAFVKDRSSVGRSTTSTSYQDDDGLVKNSAITYQQGDILYARAFVPTGIALTDTDTPNYCAVHVRLKITPSSGSTIYSNETKGWQRDDGRATKESMPLTVTDYHIDASETPFSSGVTLSFQVQYKRGTDVIGSLGATGISNWNGERVLEIWQYRKAL